MAKVINMFINGRMDSDTHYSLLDNKNYVRAKNLRLSSAGDDGAFKFLKGCQLVSDTYTNDGSVIIGAYSGKDNKIFYALAMSNGKSKIVEYDTETNGTRLIIEDTQYLRFDLIRWNNGVEITPHRYLLSINQIGNLLFFSNQVWEYPRMISLDRLQDYASGFTEEDIIMVKKPPFDSPKLLSKSNTTSFVDEENANVFVSFTYRYKYKDSDYSSLSFYTEASFEPKDFRMNGLRKNLGMENKFNLVQLAINTGGKNVTDIEVYAREHGSNTAYLIYNLNKDQANIGDNSDFLLDYNYSKNYEVLDEATTNMLYSNAPLYPHTQESVGNRMFYGNFIEGFDLKNKLGVPNIIDYEVIKSQKSFSVGGNNKTAVSMFTYKIAPIFYNDYNISTTALLPADPKKAEVSVGYEDRTKVNNLLVKFHQQFTPPAFATKMKFVVKRTTLNYENLVFNNIKEIGKKLYLYLSGENTNKIKKADIIYFTKPDITTYKSFEVEEVSLFRKEDGVSKEGYYAVIEDEDDFLTFEKNAGIEGNYLNVWKQGMNSAIIGTKITDFRNISFTFNNTLSNYYFDNNFMIIGNGNYNYGYIGEGDEIEVSFLIHMIRDFGHGTSRILGKVPMASNILVAEKEYSSISAFLREKFTDFKYEMSGSDTTLIIKTSNDFQDYMRDNYPDIYNTESEKGKRIDGVGVLDIKLKRGIKGGYARVKNHDVVEDQLYYETDKTYPIINGVIQSDTVDVDGTKFFDINFYNGYCWGNGVESYKIRDEFTGKALNSNFRPNGHELNGYKAVKKANDITYTGLYNYEMKRNELSTFNPSLANWKTLPSEHGAIQRLMSTDNNLTVYCNDRVMLVMYEKSILYDLTGNENVALTNEVLGATIVLDYKFGVGNNPESIVATSNIHYFLDPIRKRFLLKSGKDIQELNGKGTGFFSEGIKLISDHTSFLGSYDDSNDEYVIGFDQKFSLAYSLSHKGFTSYYENKYDYLIGANGKFYTGYKGKLYQKEVTEDYNNFAGQGSFNGSLTFVVAPDFAIDKIYQAMYLQSNTAWATKVKTNLTSTTIPESFYDKRESFYFTNVLRDTGTQFGIMGVGAIKSINGLTITYDSDISNMIFVGDSLNTESLNNAKKIQSINGNTITLEDVNGFSTGDFTVAQRLEQDSIRPNGVPIRGEWMELTLTKSGNQPYYITSVATEVKRSAD